MLVLGIETSCDETSAAIVEDGKRILSNIIASQTDLHSKFGGVVPELASRRHIQVIVPIINESLSVAGITLKDVDGIAVTQGPGLIGSLLIGISISKALAYTQSIPVVGVNHIEGHIYSNLLEHDDLSPPFVSLVVSGGHTELVYVADHRKYERLGQTLDDAAGEAFDKVAKLLNLGYPGGPVIDRLSREGDPKAIPFPRPYIWEHGLNFSFSGLKTSVLNFVVKNNGNISPPDICASFQQAVIDVLTEKTIRAAEIKKVDKIAIAGGVAANSGLRGQMSQRCKELGLSLYYPSLKLCTDNAAMIAGLGYHLLTELSKDQKEENWLNLDSDAIKRSPVG